MGDCLLAVFVHIEYLEGGVWVHRLGVRGDRGRVILVVRECIKKALVVLLVLPTFEDIGSLGYLLRRSIYSLSVFYMVIVSRFLAGKRKVDLKRITFSLLLLLRFYLSSLFSIHLPSNDIVP